MKRDDDLIRALLFEAEASDEAYLFELVTKDSTADEERRYMHAVWLSDAGFFQEANKGVFRITNQGHDYLAAIRDEGIWLKTKAAASTVGGVGLSVMKDIASAYVKQELSDRLGIIL